MPVFKDGIEKFQDSLKAEIFKTQQSFKKNYLHDYKVK